jgi:hypothetical protein
LFDAIDLGEGKEERAAASGMEGVAGYCLGLSFDSTIDVRG